ncbi:MAG: tetratricopeptide repeat protein [Candidatus Kaelpia imicola]|nr:tetratricopeptide repeat protein [Candidatus Kaelpia imicola]
MYQAWVNSAFSKYRMGRIEEAIEDIRRAIAIESEVYDHLPPEIQEKLLEEQ